MLFLKQTTKKKCIIVTVKYTYCIENIYYESHSRQREMQTTEDIEGILQIIFLLLQYKLDDIYSYTEGKEEIYFQPFISRKGAPSILKYLILHYGFSIKLEFILQI